MLIDDCILKNIHPILGIFIKMLTSITQRPITNKIRPELLTPNIIYYTLLPKSQPLLRIDVVGVTCDSSKSVLAFILTHF